VTESSRNRLAFAGAPPSRTARWTLTLAAIAFIAYFGVLVASDLLRVVPLGFVPQFGPEGMTVASVEADTVAAHAGLLPGDRLVRANEQWLQAPLDWQRVRLSLDVADPLELEIARGGQPFTIRLPLAGGLSQWRTGPSRPGLLTFRLAQAITLVLALVVGFSRMSEPAARLGALLLASFATFSLVLPMRMFHFWDALPQPLRALLWFPYATSVSLGALLFIFFAVFPLRFLRPSTLVVAHGSSVQ